MHRKHLRIEGHVQGVGYRAWLAQQARELGVGGWVRNLRDGSVEALLHGPEAAVEALIKAAGMGPPMAQVRWVDVTDDAGQDSHPGFELRPTL